MSWWGGLIASVGSRVGAMRGERGAENAAEARENGINAAMEDLGLSYDEAVAYMQPRYEQEQAAMGRVNSLLGLGGEAPDYDQFRDTPGYQFQMDEGTRAVERSAAARGGLNSGNTLADLTRYSQGLADTTFNNYLNQVMGLQNQGVDNTLMNMRYGHGMNTSNLELARGEARASGIEGATGAWMGHYNNIADIWGGEMGGGMGGGMGGFGGGGGG